MNADPAEAGEGPLLEVSNLSKEFFIAGSIFGGMRKLSALSDISFSVTKGETLAIVGESGCGKSTLGRTILRLIESTDGQILWEGKDLAAFDDETLRMQRRNMQIIFQDPIASLDPRMTVGQIIGEPLTIFEKTLSKAERAEKIRAIMTTVGLTPEMVNRYPHEFSGGQAQRIGIARALVSRPDLLICDEPVSALDVSIQAQIINLLIELKQQFQLTMLFISHDLSVVRYIADRVLVLYLGRVMEIAPKSKLFSTPMHPYTRALLSAAPVPNPRLARERKRIPLEGDIPSPLNPPSGCVFRTRCPFAREKCAESRPQLRPLDTGQKVACHFAEELAQEVKDMVQ
ncbi:MAG TPA: dipeptide ABC transporter ATP-binding protein [Hyphomicrobiales bacterium]|nr:dipeptide ABC transporter ATP-binding protein [Hyphomicrobiales bacterium]